MKLTLNGQTAYAYTGGKPFDPTLPCVVFVHGAQHDHSVWALQSRYFAHHGYSVLAVDLPGHNRSSGAPLPSIEALADWIADLLTAAGVTQPSLLVGHSMGSLIALETAHRHPQRVAKIALIGTAFPMKVSDTLLQAALNQTEQAISMVNEWSHSSIASKPSNPGPGAWLHGGNQRLMERVLRNNPAKVFHTDFTACNAYANGQAAAQSLHCPALFVMGKKDVMTPLKSGSALAQVMHKARSVVLDCGHAIMAEKPDETLDALIAFLR